MQTTNNTFRNLHFWQNIFRYIPPEMPGKTRLARRILENSLRTQDIDLHDQQGCTFLVPSLYEPIAFHLLIDGVYESATMKFLLRFLKPGDTYVDVGANIGIFVVPVAKKLSPSGLVLAIEPSPGIFPYLRANIEKNGVSRVHLRQCAAYDSEIQDLDFYEAPPEHFGMGSLAPQFNRKPVSVDARTLDDILIEENIHHVNVLKVDVEGFESAVFRGAKKLLTSDRPPLVIFEFCDWAECRAPGVKAGDAQKLLKDYGYQIWRLSDISKSSKRPLPKILLEGYELLVATKDNVGLKN